MAVEDKFNINLNQNLWGLVVAYAALGVAEHWCLRWLFRLSLCRGNRVKHFGPVNRRVLHVELLPEKGYGLCCDLLTLRVVVLVSFGKG